MIRCRSVTLVLVGLVLWLTACTSYRRIKLEQVPGYDQVRVTTTDETRYDLKSPIVRGDTIRGQEVVPAIPLTKVAKLEGREPNVLKTLGAVLGFAAVAAITACAANDCIP